MIENKESKQFGIKSVINAFGDDLSQEAKNILYKLSDQEKKYWLQKAFNRDRNLEYDFRDYKSLKGLFKDNY